MSNEIIKDELVSGNVEFIDKIQFTSQNKIFTDKEISKVLLIRNKASVLHCEVLDGEIHVSGKLISNAVFTSTDVEKSSAEAEMEFNEILKNNLIKQGDEVCIKAQVVDFNVESVSVSEISISATIELKAKLTNFETLSYVTGGGDGLYVLEDDFTNTFLTSSGKQNFEIEIEEQNRGNASNVLCASSCLKLKNVKCMNGIAQIDGSAFYNLVLNNNNEINVLNDQSLFSEEIALEGVDENANVFASLSVESTETEILENKILIKIKAAICFDVYKTCKLKFVSDAFSVTNETNLNVVSALQKRFAYNFGETAEVVGNITVKDENFEIRRIIGTVPADVLVSNIQIEGENISVEGVANFTAIYEDVDDVIDSVDVEIPFVNTFKAGEPVANADLTVSNACVCDVKAKIRKANEIEISAEIDFCFNVFENNEFAFVSDVELGEDKPADDSALVIYTIKNGESIFDVAKKLSIGIAELKAQNPALEEGETEGLQVVVYKQKNIN